ncbi:MAG: cytochrome c nitrite reductase small subunit [Anaerolineales bacterium]|nr:cytochrome c nitrite reductase small subunit [Anaerolineales bacterium]
MIADLLWRKFGAYFSAIPFAAWLFLFGLGGGIFGLGAFTFDYAHGSAYLSDDPRACANCHVMRDVYDGWNRSPHHTVAVCNDCHTPHSSFVAKYAIKGLNGFNHSKAFTLNDFPEPIRITALNREVTQESCLYCHGEMVTLIAHTDANAPTDCLTCHAGVGHGK